MIEGDVVLLLSAAINESRVRPSVAQNVWPYCERVTQPCTVYADEHRAVVARDLQLSISAVFRTPNSKGRSESDVRNQRWSSCPKL